MSKLLIPSGTCWDSVTRIIQAFLMLKLLASFILMAEQNLDWIHHSHNLGYVGLSMSTPPIILSKAVISEHLRMDAERGELAMLTRLHVYENKKTGERQRLQWYLKFIGFYLVGVVCSSKK